MASTTDEQDRLQKLTDSYTDLERGSLAAFDGDVMAGFMKTGYQPTAEDIHRVVMYGGVAPTTGAKASAPGC